MAFSDCIETDMFQGVSLVDLLVTLMLIVVDRLRDNAVECIEDRPVLIVEFVTFQIVALLLESLLGELVIVLRGGKT